MTPEEQKALDALKQQNEELLKRLELAHLKITGLELMIDQAEQELNVDIRKKPGTKQSQA
jgi:transposase